MDKLIVDSKKVAEIKYKALQKLAANQDRPLSEASIEARAVIEVVNEIYELNELSPQANPVVCDRKTITTIEDIPTFKISEAELRGINRWKDAIKEVYGEYGSYEYRFGIGSGIGYTIKVFSNLTKTEKDFTDYSNW